MHHRSSDNQPHGLERTVQPHERQDDRIRVRYTWKTQPAPPARRGHLRIRADRDRAARFGGGREQARRCRAPALRGVRILSATRDERGEISNRPLPGRLRLGGRLGLQHSTAPSNCRSQPWGTHVLRRLDRGEIEGSAGVTGPGRAPARSLLRSVRASCPRRPGREACGPSHRRPWRPGSATGGRKRYRARHRAQRSTPPRDTLRADVSLFGGQPGPAHRRAIVLRNAVPEVVRLPKTSLPDSVSLLGGLTGPAHRLPVVLHNAMPEVVRLSEDPLPERVSLLGSQTGPVDGRIPDFPEQCVGKDGL